MLKSRFRSLVARVTQTGKSLRKDNSGLALIEFAYSIPVLFGLSITGADAAMYVQMSQKVSQIALATADNASRLGLENGLQARRVFEGDVIQIFSGAEEQSGKTDFYDNARIILSSVELDGDNLPYIHWQRCAGGRQYSSTHGNQGAGKSDDSLEDGIGPAGRKVLPVPASAVMFVEISYQYKSLFGLEPFDGREIVQTAAFNVRETRDLAQLYTTNANDAVAWCRMGDIPRTAAEVDPNELVNYQAL